MQNKEDDDEDNEYIENLAPNAEQLQLDGLEHQREAEQNLPLPERVPSALISRSYHHENEWSENAYHAEVSKLNKKQFQFVSEFLFHLRSEEHTSELQSQFRISYAVFCLKKKKQQKKKKKKQTKKKGKKEKERKTEDR